MKEIYDPQYYNTLCSRYERKLPQEPGRLHGWLDDTFYQGFRAWLKEEYNIENYGTCILTFQDDRDYIMFMLKWS
jgi:hypothetical protein